MTTKDFLDSLIKDGYFVGRRFSSSKNLESFFEVHPEFRSIYANFSDREEIGYLINHNLSEQPKCKFCENPAKYIKGFGYTKSCKNLACKSKAYREGRHSVDDEKALKKRKQTKLQRYGSENYNNPDKHKITMQERYGVSSSLENSIFREKAKQTKLERYGNASFVNQEKGKSTKLERYGNPNYNNPEKRKNTMIDKCGVEYALQDSNLVQKRRDTMLERYGSTNNSNLCVPETTRAIIDNKEAFLSYLQDKMSWGAFRIAEDLHLNPITIYKRFREFGLENLINSASSFVEGEIVDFLKECFPTLEILRNARDLINPKELDIYIPSCKIAIEYNGSYWHSSIYKDVKYHQQKTLSCTEKGIHLIHIFEYEWFDPSYQKRIKDYLRYCVGSAEVLYARKCSLKKVSTLEERSFLNNNHLQGYIPSKEAYGLYYNEELVSLMTFGKSRYNKKYEWELLRFANKGNLRITGAASRLLKAFEREQNPTNLISYCNITKMKGTLYPTLGFISKGVSYPNYKWVRDTETFSRYQCQKKTLIKQGFGDLGDTEEEIMTNRGFYKVYDSGNITFEKIYKK